MISYQVSVTAQDVAAFVGRPGDQGTIERADGVLQSVIDAVHGYTRGNGFDPQIPSYMSPDLATVVKTVAARIMANPSGLRTVQTTGPYSHDVAGWSGFTLFEQVALNRWRTRAL